MLHFLWMCIIGPVAGALAKLIVPGKDPGGIIVTMLLGIAGSLLAGFLGRALGWYQEGQGAGLIMSVVGAILLLAVYHLVKRRSASVGG
ncbi:MAG: GlsB/YeaQ/YmgE family stress response membrane protein [Acidobacteria bacterium]|nr:GlsB/YeaQ/YmgE family stress response membrane protein [Acidobacteriota bacterium]